MKTSNGYISLGYAQNLIQKGWVFRQDLKQTEFKVMKGENSPDYYKLNRKTAVELKKTLTQIINQVKITL